MQNRINVPMVAEALLIDHAATLEQHYFDQSHAYVEHVVLFFYLLRHLQAP